MGALLRAGQLALGAAVVGAVAPACYSAGAGTAPPPDSFYFPVGLAVSPAADVLYAVNSDFDLQWNGGTLQSYDLAQIRTDVAALVTSNLVTLLPPADPTVLNDLAPFLPPLPGCPGQPPAGGAYLGQACAPPVQSATYIKHSVIIGAFATDVQLSVAQWPAPTPPRLYVPVRGEAAVTWADIGVHANGNAGDIYEIDCGQDPTADNRCDDSYKAGSDPNQPGNTRQVTMPGEPFGIAQTEDGTALAVTSQTDTKTSLLTTGFPPPPPPYPHDSDLVTMQYVLDGLPVGGVGIAAVPHDPDAPVPPCEDVGDMPPCVRAAFLETNRNTAELDLLRYYDDDGSTLHRPFLQREAVYPITSNAIGTDSRGIVMDPTQRLACKALGNDPTLCAQIPARVFFASRTPPVISQALIGGVPTSGVGDYDPDLVTLLPSVSVNPGPSNIYIAPIVDPQGHFQLRVFEVLFDSNQIAVYDPDDGTVNFIDVGVGPFAMAFDPFSLEDVATHAAPTPYSSGGAPYRFAYVTSFTQSYVQVIDLDASQPTPQTFEQVVFNLGIPTLPKGQ